MKATVILQKCTKTKKMFGVRIQEMEDGEWYRTWAFPIDEGRAAQEGYQNTQIKSFLPAVADYPGCPYCGSTNFFYDCNCGKISCYYGDSTHTCPWCNNTYSDLGSMTEKVSFTGGDI